MRYDAETTYLRPVEVEIKGIDEANREVTGLISTETVDRDGEMLIAGGADLVDYLKNPVVLWMHDQRLPAIGKCTDVAVAGQGLQATTRFANHQLAGDVWELYRGGFLKAFSVGFRIDWRGEGKPYEYDEAADAFVIKRWKLYEYSCVNVPSNPDALVKAAGAGHDAAARICQAYWPGELTKSPEERAAADIARAIGGLESLRNYHRHCLKQAKEFPVELERLAEANELLSELLGKSLETAEAEPNPPIGAPSDDELAEQTVLDALKSLREAVAEDALHGAIRAELQELRRSYIGGRR